MTIYRSRKIQFRETVEIENWKIKIYSISKHGDFNFPEFYKNVIYKLPIWLKQNNGFNDQHSYIGFLILHAGTEGIFSLINWWVDLYMLNTNIYFTEYDKLDIFKKISGNGLAPCIWEFEVINYERMAWTKQILKKIPNPDFDTYLASNFNKAL